VGDPDDQYLAYRDRLYVAKKDAGYSVVSYHLSDLKADKLVYRSGDSKGQIQLMTACGGHVCLLDQTGYDDTTTQVRVLDPDAAKVLWSRPAGNAASITAVGDRVLVSGGTSTVFNKLYDPAGKLLVQDDSPDWVRVNAGSLLLFALATSDYGKDMPIAGLGAQSGRKTSMGVLREVRSSSCAWTDQLLACARDDDFAIWKLTR
jgi:molecular chaperone HscA